MELTRTTQATYTEDQVRAAARGAAAMLAREISDANRDTDLIKLMFHATLHLLREPDATFADVAHEGYQFSAQEIKGWWTGWS
ncbi:hypothetical protein [Catenulispora rubra]|uniref:hypothetical protein n=1 Tax=Catenulispora rubra TaxID=280293 RepID=UPI0018920C7B|nr:hypothetical protein [Catenulispora rubra]